ncbi:hypothetical protein A3C23_04950 [Candidatus Roizmanbacteria bacterium RIFCSPHIGHO2_02_FULL_37_13b]|uniref:RRM domain-containing protein n=1 Tax=Candidatus Roizmanbacteria bacterium RIFCSPLOWO2_02_FULL_36_11 TaxID=1802071 RepID=A0A1F7JCT8_9BACT|nr:MAG: hypothetical protein A3C23_04950 [Candidatus Roizmanbacteria bacterium RIFCSPHIGHO2_02_FULL_37_13b]OGK53428.1 MAG: hypothetical protein A3H78_02745 [Candidatus Roizmanbacteria bacterium RIFCSPLOWO2_02_FULL_36_11]
MSQKLYVGNLLYESTEEELKEYFGQAGAVLGVNIIRFRDGKSKGFAFVEMENEEGAKKAIDEMNGKEYKGRTLVVAQARPQQPREEDNQA